VRLRGQLATEADVSLGNSRLILAESQHQRPQSEIRNARTELQALTIVPVSADGGIPSRLTQLPPTAEIEELTLSQAADLQVKRKPEIQPSCESAEGMFQGSKASSFSSVSAAPMLLST